MVQKIKIFKKSILLFSLFLLFGLCLTVHANQVFEVQGISSSQKQPAAIINQQFVKENDIVDGYTVQKISNQSIIFTKGEEVIIQYIKEETAPNVLMARSQHFFWGLSQKIALKKRFQYVANVFHEVFVDLMVYTKSPNGSSFKMFKAWSLVGKTIIIGFVLIVIATLYFIKTLLMSKRGA